MSIFESGVRDRGPVRAQFLSGDSAGARRLRRPLDRIGRGHMPRPAVGSGGPIRELTVGAGRLLFPVLLLLTLGAAALIYGNEPADWLGGIGLGGLPLPSGLLILPVSFFVVHLTNRRYGAAYATIQVLAASFIFAYAIGNMRADLVTLRGSELPSMRAIAGFGTGLLIAQLVSVIVFDRLRGPRWWEAPFFASLTGGVVLCIVAFPLAYAGAGSAWAQPMLVFMAVVSAAAGLFLVPYWLMRALIAPLPGFGGY